jgi:hypothetical protein
LQFPEIFPDRQKLLPSCDIIKSRNTLYPYHKNRKEFLCGLLVNLIPIFPLRNHLPYI